LIFCKHCAILYYVLRWDDPFKERKVKKMNITDLVTQLKEMNVIEAVDFLISMIPNVAVVPAANILIPAAVAIVCIIFANYGKKLLNLLKFVVCAGACYYLGAVMLWEHVAKFLEPHGVTNVIAGIALAVIGALVSKFAYAIVFAGSLGYVAYLLVPVVAPVDSLITHILIAVGVGVIALIFRGLLETILTSVIGGAGFSVGLYAAIINAVGAGIKLDGSTPVLGPLTFETVVLVVVAALVCFAGYIRQVKNRHRF
jgi:hypothetical protein